jgi:hypothetical protein
MEEVKAVVHLLLSKGDSVIPHRPHVVDHNLAPVLLLPGGTVAKEVTDVYEQQIIMDLTE